jgi:hypothetical protein
VLEKTYSSMRTLSIRTKVLDGWGNTSIAPVK